VIESVPSCCEAQCPCGWVVRVGSCGGVWFFVQQQLLELLCGSAQSMVAASAALLLCAAQEVLSAVLLTLHCRPKLLCAFTASYLPCLSPFWPRLYPCPCLQDGTALRCCHGSLAWREALKRYQYKLYFTYLGTGRPNKAQLSETQSQTVTVTPGT